MNDIDFVNRLLVELKGYAADHGISGDQPLLFDDLRNILRGVVLSAAQSDPSIMIELENRK